MSLKNILLNTANIILSRIIQLFGIIIIIIGLLFLLSLISYSPDDPNFIFLDNKDIKNFLGFKGSLMSDFFFSSYWLNVFFNPYNHYDHWYKYLL